MPRARKIIIIGTTGYRQQAPQRIDCYTWEQVISLPNLRDYDIVILNLLSLNSANADWTKFEQALDLKVAIDILKVDGTIIVIGDPRFNIPFYVG